MKVREEKEESRGEEEVDEREREENNHQYYSIISKVYQTLIIQSYNRLKFLKIAENNIKSGLQKKKNQKFYSQQTS